MFKTQKNTPAKKYAFYMSANSTTTYDLTYLYKSKMTRQKE